MCVQGVTSSYAALEGLRLPYLRYRLVLRFAAAWCCGASDGTSPSSRIDWNEDKL